MYGKATETAIASMSRLAEVYDGGRTKLSAADIAAQRKLQGPFVAKVLTTLSQAGLVAGSRGPGGGFTLAKHPSRIKLHDVYKLFESDNSSDNCPFGGGICGVGEPCPLHNKLVNVRHAIEDVLEHTTFDAFRIAYQVDGHRPAVKRPRGRKKPRASFRARSEGA